MKPFCRIAVTASVIILALALSSCGRQEAPTPTEKATEKLQVRGAGATFPAALYQKWIETYKKQNRDLELHYESVGSGEGIKRFIAGSVDFAASDAAMKDSEIAQVKRGVRLVPTTAGMVVLAYNLWGVEGDLKLKRDVYVDIFSGKIRKWNDPRIKEANPHVTLPSMDITTVSRLDSSGTTYALTNHLSAISEQWKDGPGAGKLIDWPGPTMVARGNEGVAQRMKLSEGSIGYVEYGFAKRLGLRVASLENKAGQFIKPELQSGRMALTASSRDTSHTLQSFSPDPDGAGSYPIVSFSWLLLYEQYPDSEKANALKDVVAWGLTEGQKYAEKLGYISLPQDVVSRALEVVNRS
ncbi:MAG: phosphate ABC transporter substrate-binding protein PstS [Gammaproteobacteria bacterium]